jgi:pyruvate dehydrogenase E2 component (dihydrolipoamide acetyltransferase)
MPVEIVVPRLGWNMDEGVFVGWLKADGDAVAPGEPLFAIETDKAVQEVESIDRGVLRLAPGAPQPGATVEVGRVIGYLLQPGEAMPSAMGTRNRPVAAPAQTGAVPPTAGARPGLSRVRVTPRARRLAATLGVDPSTLHGTGRNARVRERDVQAIARRARAPLRGS